MAGPTWPPPEIGETPPPPTGPAGPEGGWQPGAGLRHGPSLPPGVTWAGMAPRLAATVVDLVVVGVAWFVGAELFLAVISATGSLDLSSIQPPSLGDLTMSDQEFRLGLFLLGIWFALRGLYLVYAWSRFGATVGNQLLRLRVVDVRTGGHLSTRRAAARWVVSELPGLGLLLDLGILLWYAALVVSIGRDPYRRGFHDRVAGSVVVRHRLGDAHGQGGSPV